MEYNPTPTYVKSPEFDQRIFDRAPSSLSAKFTDSWHDFGAEMFIVNVSAGGLHIISKRPLILETHISIQIKIKEDREPLNLITKVAWVNNLNPFAVEAGLQIIKVKLTKVSLLYDFNRKQKLVFNRVYS